MSVIYCRNINEALIAGIQKIKQFGKPISPRGLETLELPGPFMTVYRLPRERVLFCPERDANPFFHFFEALWILAGRMDVPFLQQFNKNITQYSDDGYVFHGAYGWRLRRWFGFDQLERAISVLNKDLHSRKAVLQVWDAREDLDHDTKDLPCNDMIFLKVRENRLNLTVCCRSNDMVWGCYGANVVQFSTLQEYLAARLGVSIGWYAQVSDSFHVYTSQDAWIRIKDLTLCNFDFYRTMHLQTFPLVEDVEKWDSELERFLADMDGEIDEMFPSYRWQNSYFPSVAQPIWKAWVAHKKDNNGLDAIEECMAPDWRLACKDWLERRKVK